MAATPLRIDVISDVVCPWCVIGYGNLLQALTRWGGEYELYWQPFQLNPDMVDGGENLSEHLAAKYGSTPEQSVAIRERITALGAEQGFRFSFAPDIRIYNTFKAHQLLHWAAEQGQQTALKLALFECYFSERQAIDQIDVLVNVAEKTGLDAEEARAVLMDERYRSVVEAEAAGWVQAGINSVPAVVFNRELLVSGAQESGTFLQVLEQIG